MAHKKLTSQELRKFEDVLRRMLGVLTGDIQQLEDETIVNPPPGDVSAEDTGSIVHSIEISLELLELEGDVQSEIMGALTRLEQGVFGLCTRCQKPVPRTRLLAMPHAEHCIDCQRDLEQRA